jgi:hypothetical protein
MSRSTSRRAGSTQADALKRSTRRRRTVLVPLAAIGVAAWAAHRTLGGRRSLTDGWQTLPPAPVAPAPAGRAPVADVPVADEPAVDAPQAEVAPLNGSALQNGAAPPAPAPPVAMPPIAPARASDPDDAPHGPGSRRALADGSSPDPAFTVKGKSATRIFHAPGGAYYTRTRADVWFRTADDARAAGFTERVRRTAQQDGEQLPAGTTGRAR